MRLISRLGRLYRHTFGREAELAERLRIHSEEAVAAQGRAVDRIHSDRRKYEVIEAMLSRIHSPAPPPVEEGRRARLGAHPFRLTRTIEAILSRIHEKDR